MKEIKEEADRLVELYFLADNNINDMLTETQAKQCAIIDVTNTIDFIEGYAGLVEMKDDWEFLNKVKQELESRL